MAARLREHATYEDLAQLPENMVGELIEGELYASPRPSGRHTRASSRLGAILTTTFDLGHGDAGGWWILDEPELHFGRNVLVPDLAGWRKERMPDLPENHIFDIVPDWICEVTSPSNNKLDRVKKMPIYAREGVSFAWLIDPKEQVLEARKLHEAQWIVIAEHVGDQIVRIEPFTEIEIDLTLIWGPALPA